MKILIWHVHGSWTTAFVQGRHEYLLPVTPRRDADGLGRARTWDWPASAREVTPEQLREEGVDAVVLQRVRDLELVREWLDREPGRDLPAGDDGRLAVRRPLAPVEHEAGYLVLHPGASVPARAWPAERCAEAVEALSDAGWRVLVTGGPDERALTAAVAGARPLS